MNNPSTENQTRKVLVIGHKNPDTDSICSAIAYADLQNKSASSDAQKSSRQVEFVPCRAGVINKETEYVLKRFHYDLPKLCLDVHMTVSDLDLRTEDGIVSATSLRDAWQMMREKNLPSLAVMHADRRIEGIISVQDIAMANMDSVDSDILSKGRVPLRNLLKTINGTLVNGDPDSIISSGRLSIGAGSAEALENALQEGDIIIVANRYEAQLCAIEMGVSVLIICLASTIAKTIVKLAEERGCIVISTPYDTYTTARTINQSIPVGNYMTKNVTCFDLDTPLQEVKEVMGRVKFNYFPILDEEKHYVGMISKRNLIDVKQKDIVLVDHNEKSQCVDGIEEANVVGIVDHHRIGDVETLRPIEFRNQPVGCTATIITDMYRENGVAIETGIAGLLCCAILSDTLAFQSPTCTIKDKMTARELAVIAGVDLDRLANAMFDAGEDLSGKTPEMIFHNDCKLVRSGDRKLSIAQGTFNSRSNLDKAIHLIEEQIEQYPDKENADYAFYIATSIHEKSSTVLYAGTGAKELLLAAFPDHTVDANGRIQIAGLVSRKKQFVPSILKALDEE